MAKISLFISDLITKDMDLLLRLRRLFNQQTVDCYRYAKPQDSHETTLVTLGSCLICKEIVVYFLPVVISLLSSKSCENKVEISEICHKGWTIIWWGGWVIWYRHNFFFCTSVLAGYIFFKITHPSSEVKWPTPVVEANPCLFIKSFKFPLCFPDLLLPISRRWKELFCH